MLCDRCDSMCLSVALYSPRLRLSSRKERYLYRLMWKTKEGRLYVALMVSISVNVQSFTRDSVFSFTLVVSS